MMELYNPAYQHQILKCNQNHQNHQTDTSIISQKGTVRGVRDRVRSNIQNIKDRVLHPNAKDYENIEKGKIIVYTTSVKIVRNIAERCIRTRRILQTHMVSYEERDLFMSLDNQHELVDRLSIDASRQCEADRILPQIFFHGKLLGGADTLENFNETGKLKFLLKEFPKMSLSSPCEYCGGYRYLPCTQCHGSKRSLLRNHYTTEFVTLRCILCDENGLVKCGSCNKG